MMAVESKSQILDISDDLEIPTGCIVSVQKENVWSPYFKGLVL